VIAYLSGVVSSLDPSEAVIEVGGVGFAVQCTPGTLAGLRIGTLARVPTALIVREESLTLFGFADDDDRDVFQLLQTASGIGPKLAQAMLAVHDPESLRRAVATDDLTALTAVPGIGRKGAQRIVLELKDRLGPPGRGGVSPGATAASPAVSAGADGWRDQVRDGLVGLGWSTREAEDAVAVVAAQLDDDAAAADDTVVDLTDAAPVAPDVAELMRAALRTLSRR